MINNEEKRIFIDSHVHWYQHDRLSDILNKANRNFNYQARQMNWPIKYLGMLFILKTHHENQDQFIDRFHSFSAERSAKHPMEWTLHATATPQSYLTKSHDGQEIYIILGSQVRTIENLEVLSLGTDSHIADNRSIRDTIKAVWRHNGIPVIPWGAGKWLGKRRSVMQHLIEKGGVEFYLGDNGGRPQIWKKVGLFETAERKRIPILRGSDPLGLPGEINRIGSFGFSVKGEMNEAQPIISFKNMLKHNLPGKIDFGNLQSNRRFLTNQIRMRMSKKR